MIFKIANGATWRAACDEGEFRGSADDLRDGFIHFSAPHQVRETAAKHFKGQRDLLLLAFDETRLGEALVWEPSRGGDLFPHLYGALSTSLVLWERALNLDADGIPIFPEGVAG